MNLISAGFTDALKSPLGLVGVAAMVVWFVLAGKNPTFKWIGLGITMYAASLNKFYDEYLEMEWYPLYGPVETLVQNGRIVTMVCLLALLAVSFSGNRNHQKVRPPRMMWPIHGIQVLLLVKMLVGSVSLGFLLQAAVVYLLIGALGVYGVRSWLQTEDGLHGPAAALTTAVGLFCMVVEWQLHIDPTAALLDNGRLIGTTGNPQHAAVLLAACLPGPLYFAINTRKSPWFLRLGCVLLLVSMVHLLGLTGSRTGGLMAAISIIIFFRRRLALGAVMIGLAYAAYAFLLTPGDEDFAERMMSLEDTRSHVWEAQWRVFLRNPVFGAPLEGNRLGFGENSWLALLASTGAMGASLLIWLLISIFREFRGLYHKELKAGRPTLEVDFCLAGFAALFAGSFLEAYLLGIISLPILAILTYSSASDKILTTGEFLEASGPPRRNGRRPRSAPPGRHIKSSSDGQGISEH